jgi:hypothetical protein
VASRRQDMVFKLYERDCLVDRTKKLRINHRGRLEAIEALVFSNQILSNFWFHRGFSSFACWLQLHS